MENRGHGFIYKLILLGSFFGRKRNGILFNPILVSIQF